MPRKKSVHVESLKEILLKFKSFILKDTGNLPLKSDKIWNMISLEMKGNVTPLAVYTIVKKNRYDVWNVIEYKQNSENLEKISHSEVESRDESEISSDESKCIEFKVLMSPDEFSNLILQEKVYPCSEDGRKNKIRNYLTFKRGWTHKMNNIISKNTTLDCTLIFKRVKINPRGLNFVTIHATCKSCHSTLEGTIDKKPIENEDAVIFFKYIGNFKKPHLTNVKRPLSSSARQEAVAEMLQTNVAASAYRQIKAHETMKFGDREPSNIPSSNVLRVAKHKTLTISRAHKNPILALGILKKKPPCENTIRDIGYDRFFVHYWSAAQIHVYNEYCKKSVPSTIAIDATGSICHKIKRLAGEKSRNIFLYEITVLDKEDTQQYSVGNMLSERHDSNSIYFWLSEWRRSGASKPDIVVSDMSIALLSAATKAFTQFTSLTDYLHHCYEMIVGNSQQELPKTFTRCDVAHFIKLVSTWKSLNGQIKRNRQFYLSIMAQAVQADSIELLKKILYATITVALSETEGSDDAGELVPK